MKIKRLENMILYCILMPDIKSIRLDIINNDIERNKFLTFFLNELDENNIKCTCLVKSKGYYHFIIFDTFDDFMLFKLKFNDNIDIKYAQNIMRIFDSNYDDFKTQMTKYIEKDIEIFTMPKNNERLYL